MFFKCQESHVLEIGLKPSIYCALFIIRGPAGCIGDINHENIKQPDLMGSSTYVDSTGDLNQPCYQHAPLNKATDAK